MTLMGRNLSGVAPSPLGIKEMNPTARASRAASAATTTTQTYHGPLAKQCCENGRQPQPPQRNEIGTLGMLPNKFVSFDRVCPALLAAARGNLRNVRSTKMIEITLRLRHGEGPLTRCRARAAYRSRKKNGLNAVWPAQTTRGRPVQL